MAITNFHEFFIQWHLTERCNLSCAHCYQTGGKSAELSLEEIRSVAEEVAEMLGAWSEAYGISFSRSVSVTGGEPFLRHDISEILETIRIKGFDLYLLSNGTLIDEGRAKMLSRLSMKGVQISVEGPENVHDAIRGKGSFSASMEGIRHLLDAGLKVTVNATLSELNSGHLHDLAEIALSLGVQRLGFSRLVPSGRGLGLIDRMIEREKVRKIYEEIFSLRPAGLEIVTGDPVASQMSCPAGEDAGTVATGGCAAGLSGLTFLPDGTIVPCRRLFVPIGNVRNDTIREVWASSPVLEALRDRTRYKGRCGDCRRWAGCRGCRAIAYAYSSAKGKPDFLSEDPQCFIGKEDESNGAERQEDVLKKPHKSGSV
ncbi:MAG: radical SAM protein [Acidobacteriota bacterium]